MRLLLVTVDVPPDNSSFKEPIANQGCNMICFLFLATLLLKVFFIYFWTFKLIGFFGEGTFKKDPEAEHLVAGGLV